MELAIGIFIWWLSGAIACAWSFDWGVKSAKVMTCVVLIGLTGPLCFFEAISIKRDKPLNNTRAIQIRRMLCTKKGKL